MQGRQAVHIGLEFRIGEAGQQAVIGAGIAYGGLGDAGIAGIAESELRPVRHLPVLGIVLDAFIPFVGRMQCILCGHRQLAEASRADGQRDDVGQQPDIVAHAIAQAEEQRERLGFIAVEAIPAPAGGIDDADPVQQVGAVVQLSAFSFKPEFIGLFQESAHTGFSAVEVLRHHDVDAVAGDMRQRRDDVAVAPDVFTILDDGHGNLLFIGQAGPPAARWVQKSEQG